MKWSHECNKLSDCETKILLEEGREDEYTSSDHVISEGDEYTWTHGHMHFVKET